MKFKTERIKEEWDSGKLDDHLIAKVEIWVQWLHFRAPGYIPTVTDIYRTPEEYKAIYKDEDKKPGIHTYWRSIDFRVRDMPANLAYDSARFFNMFPYDVNRPSLQTCLYGDERHNNHLHLQTCY